MLQHIQPARKLDNGENLTRNCADFLWPHKCIHRLRCFYLKRMDFTAGNNFAGFNVGS